MAILKNVQGWINGGTEPTELSVQNQIRWGGFMRGFISVEFSTLQEKFYRDQHLDTKKFSGTLWSQRLIEFVWKEAQTLWKARNREVHDEEGHQQSARELEEAKVKIRAMYSSKQHLRAVDQSILPGTAAQQLARNPRKIITFAATTYETFKFCLQDAR